MKRSRPSCDPFLPIEAFRTDPGWYDEHWLTESPVRPPGVIIRAARAAWALAGAVLRQLPTPRVLHHSPMLSNAPRTRA